MDKFSDNYSHKIANEVVLKLKEQLHSYESSELLGNTYEIFETPNKCYAINTKVRVDAGSNSLLRTNEPIIIEFSNIEDIELSYINVYPNRKDFPYDKLPHINYAVGEMPPSLCLTRENFLDWYAEHNFDDFFKLISEWYNDAAHGNLIKFKEHDAYEPFRASKTGIILFKKPWEDTILEKKKHAGSFVYSVKRIIDDCEAYEGTIGSQKYEGDSLGILLYRNCAIICKEWFIEKPKTWGELLHFIKENGFDFNIKNVRQTIERHHLKDIKNVFFQLAFVRPVKVLNKNTRIDYLYFCVKYIDVNTNNTEGIIQEVITYDIATKDLARYISATPNNISNKKILILGCGAIGSKLAYHLYRSGICNLTICDNDIMESHNVCRHALSNWDFRSSKALLVKEQLDSMFYHNNKTVDAITENILTWLPNQNLKEYDLIIEATASTAVFRMLTKVSTKCNVPIARFALSDAGKIGLLYLNYNRKNLLSDYHIQIALESCNNEDIRKWLQDEDKYNYDLIRVGEGCHSNSMILSDDTISTHCGIASNIIRNMFAKPAQENKIYISFANIEYIGQVFTDVIDLENYTSITCENDISWTVRIKSDILTEIRHNTKVAGRNETGGYLMGSIDLKYKMIYVTHNYTPSHLYSNETNLELPISEWKNEYLKVYTSSNKVIDYIGDWHSHPTGTLKMSDTDKYTCKEVLRDEINAKIGICIITNKKKTLAYLLH